MTEQQDDQTQPDTTEPAPAADAPAEAESDQSETGEGSGDADEASEDEPDKPDKPKKIKIAYEASMPRNEAVSYFEAIIGGLRSGRLEFRQDEDSLVLSPPDQLEVEVKAQLKGDKARVVFEIEWSDDHRPLEILS